MRAIAAIIYELRLFPPTSAAMATARCVSGSIHRLTYPEKDLSGGRPGLSHMNSLTAVIPAKAGIQRPKSVVSLRKSKHITRPGLRLSPGLRHCNFICDSPGACARSPCRSCASVIICRQTCKSSLPFRNYLKTGGLAQPVIPAQAGIHDSPCLRSDFWRAWRVLR